MSGRHERDGQVKPKAIACMFGDGSMKEIWRAGTDDHSLPESTHSGLNAPPRPIQARFVRYLWRPASWLPAIGDPTLRIQDVSKLTLSTSKPANVSPKHPIDKPVGDQYINNGQPL
ncbi:MAG: hypothetical protein Q9157_005611 [Trypethelium eluteriae]